jgi:hypothetical protein
MAAAVADLVGPAHSCPHHIWRHLLLLLPCCLTLQLLSVLLHQTNQVPGAIRPSQNPQVSDLSDLSDLAIRRFHVPLQESSCCCCLHQQQRQLLLLAPLPGVAGAAAFYLLLLVLLLLLLLLPQT